MKKKKAIIITYAKTSEEDKELLNKTEITKIGLNFYEYNVRLNYRLYSEPIVFDKDLDCAEKVILTQAKSEHQNAINYDKINSYGSYLLDAVAWLRLNGFRDILLVATNTVHSEFHKDKIKREISCFKNKPNVEIWQYKNRNFSLPIKSIKEFIGVV